MRILAISDDIGVTAPGIVAERLLCAAQERCEVDVVTYEYVRSKGLPEIRGVHVCGQTFRNTKVRRRAVQWSIGLLARNPFDEMRKRGLLGRLKGAAKGPASGHGGYDVILGFCYGYYLLGLTLGTYAKKAFGAPLVAYFVDAIPSPPGWIPDGRYRRSMGRMVSRGLAHSDGLLSSNAKMLGYQRGFAPAGLPSGFVYTPCLGDRVRTYPHAGSGGKFVFLFTGSVYGPRRLSYLFGAFRELLRDRPDCEIWFVGTHDIGAQVAGLEPGVRAGVKVFPRTGDLGPYYGAAGALVDIDADLPDDVFLSSKITNYILVDRPIISETGPRSESRRLFAGLDSVSQCGHSSAELLAAMRAAVDRTEPYDYSERDALARLFSLEANSEKLLGFLERISDGAARG